MQKGMNGRVGGLFLAGGQTRWKESGPGGRGLSRLLDEAARWEIGAIRVKKNPIGYREFETKQDQRCRGIDRFPEEEEQRHFHQHLTTIRPETPRVLPSAPGPDRTGRGVVRHTPRTASLTR